MTIKKNLKHSNINTIHVNLVPNIPSEKCQLLHIHEVDYEYYKVIFKSDYFQSNEKKPFHYLIINYDDQIDQKTFFKNNSEDNTLLLKQQTTKRLLFYNDAIANILHSDTSSLSDFVTLPFNELLPILSEKLDTFEFNAYQHILLVDFAFQGISRDYTCFGMKGQAEKINQIVQETEFPINTFDLKLILTELLTNAEKYGNKGNASLPIKIRLITTKNTLLIEVTDTGYKHKNLTIDTDVIHDHILDQRGRGLFIIDQLSNRVTVIGNSIYVEIKG